MKSQSVLDISPINTDIPIGNELLKTIQNWEKGLGCDLRSPFDVDRKDNFGYNPILPSDPMERKRYPVASGVLDYFPSALVEIAKVSKAGNDQHNPGEPLHWARGKSMDQADTIIRHFLERGTLDSDGLRHSAKFAWRALALLQLELEEAGAPIARGTY